MTSKQKRTISAIMAKTLMAASVCSLFALTGCDSSNSDAGANAVVAADKAARLAYSAGQVRPKSDFADSVKGKDNDEVDSIGKAAASAIKADKDNAKGVWKNYLDQKSVSGDLDAAAALLNETLSAEGLTNPSLKSAIQAQLGAIELANARLQLAAAQDKLLDLTSRAADFQIAASYINELGAQAAVEEARAKGDAAQDLTQLKSAVDDRKTAVDKAQAAVADIQKQIDDKQAAAAKIYTDTDAAFAHAENLQGTEAIDTARKAMEDRKQGDQLSSDAQSLLPTLAHAKTDLGVAQIQLADAESQLASATSGVQQTGERQQTASSQVAFLHDGVKKLIEGDSGLAARYKEFTDRASKVDADLAKAEEAANKASTAYRSAIASAATFASKISDLALDSADPLNKSAKDPLTKNLLTLAQASSTEEVGRANLIGYTSAVLQATAAQAMSQAYKAAGTPQDTAPAASAEKELASRRDAALTAFETAANSAKTVADSAREGSPDKWLGYTLASVALHGQYIIDRKDKSAYQAAAHSAQIQNPFLHLDILTGDTTASAAPATTPTAH